MKKLFVLFIILIPLFVFAEEKTIGYLGILSEPINEAMMTALDVECGVLVTKVYEETPAADAGIEVGDVICEVDNIDITDIKTLKEVIADRPGKKVLIKIIRSGQEITEKVSLGTKEIQKIAFDFEMPDLDEIKEAMELGTKEVKAQLKELQDEIEMIKQEIEDIKRQIKEQ